MQTDTILAYKLLSVDGAGNMLDCRIIERCEDCPQYESGKPCEMRSGEGHVYHGWVAPRCRKGLIFGSDTMSVFEKASPFVKDVFGAVIAQEQWNFGGIPPYCPILSNGEK